MRIRHGVPAAALLLLAAACADGADPAGSKTLILDESAYCRVYYEFGLDRIPGDLLKARGKAILGERGLTALQRQTRRLLAEQGVDWSKRDWRDCAVTSFYLNNSTGAGVDVYRARYNIADPPPANWARPDFDDSVWPRLRRPLLVGRKGTASWTDTSYLGVHRICWRTRFEVPDPGRAGRVKLRLLYRGGVRVLLNGREIARANLPAGDIGAETLADAYPLEAYIKLPGEVLTAEKEADERRRKRGRKVYRYRFVPELPAAFSEGRQLKGKEVGRPEVKGYVPDLRRVGGRAGALMSRACWDRIVAARDRVLDCELPTDALEKGSNLLALEVVAAPLHPVTQVDWMRGLRGNYGWRHVAIRNLSLTGPSSGIGTCLGRPDGVQVWTEDVHHRVYSSEFLPRGAAAGTVRIVGVRNATFSGQIVVGTSRALTGLSVIPQELKRPDGSGVIPASAASVRYVLGHPLGELVSLDSTRTVTRTRPLSTRERMAMVGYVPAYARTAPLAERLASLDELSFFDHLTDKPPERIPAGTCRPVWLSVAIPASAAPGVYRGSLRVDAEGMRPVDVPVELEVIDFCAPAPRRYQTAACLEQSPYGVAKHYGVPLWSERHWELVEASLKLLGRAGNDWWFVPCLNYSELGNRTDSMIRWIRKTDGSLAFDYSRLDRYLDLVVRHCGRPEVISFLAMHGNPANPPEATVIDERTGRPEPVGLAYPDVPYAEYRRRWAAFATALNSHMKRIGLKDAMYWGYAWDTEGLPDLRTMLTEFVPDVYWTAGGHALRVDRQYYRATAQIFGRYSLVPRSQKGWKQSGLNVLTPRGGGNTHAVAGGSLPFSYRLLADRSVAGGYRGFGRMGADYWDGAYYDGTKGGAVFLQPGMALHVLFWPGADGAESSARYEMLLEGMLEAEARIFLEQCIDRGLLPEEMARRFANLLEAHTRATMYVSIQTRTQLDEYFPGWQARSRRLFAAAGEAARVVGLGVDPPRMTVRVPARGRASATLTLRSWTGRPCPWKLEARADWLRPARAAGSTEGHEELDVVIDGARLAPETTIRSTVTVTDATSGKVHPVELTACVSKVLDAVFPTLNRREFGFLPDKGKVAFDVSPGQPATKSVVFFNHAGAPVSWKAACSLPWVTVEPASGQARPQEETILKVTATPPKDAAGIHQGRLTIDELKGTASVTTPLVVYALAPYRLPAARPAGRSVPLTADLHKQLLKSRGERHPTWAAHEVLWIGQGRDHPMPADGRERGAKVENVLVVPAPSRTIYDIEGKGFEAFSVQVDYPRSSKGYKYWAGHGKYPDWVRIRFEIYVDGRLEAHSGWMGPDDDLRALLVSGLARAKELALVTRHLRIPPAACSTGWWNGRFYPGQ